MFGINTQTSEPQIVKGNFWYRVMIEKCSIFHFLVYIVTYCHVLVFWHNIQQASVYETQSLDVFIKINTNI